MLEGHKKVEFTKFKKEDSKADINKQGFRFQKPIMLNIYFNETIFDELGWENLVKFSNLCLTLIKIVTHWLIDEGNIQPYFIG